MNDLGHKGIIFVKSFNFKEIIDCIRDFVMPYLHPSYHWSFIKTIELLNDRNNFFIYKLSDLFRDDEYHFCITILKDDDENSDNITICDNIDIYCDFQPNYCITCFSIVSDYKEYSILNGVIIKLLQNEIEIKIYTDSAFICNNLIKINRETKKIIKQFGKI
jgi:hypothetical protein